MQAFLVLLTLPRREFPMDLRYSYAVYHAHREECTYQRLGRCEQKSLYLGKNKKLIFTLNEAKMSFFFYLNRIICRRFCDHQTIGEVAKR